MNGASSRFIVVGITSGGPSLGIAGATGTVTGGVALPEFSFMGATGFTFSIEPLFFTDAVFSFAITFFNATSFCGLLGRPIANNANATIPLTNMTAPVAINAIL